MMLLPSSMTCSPETPLDGKCVAYSEVDRDVSESSSNP